MGCITVTMVKDSTGSTVNKNYVIKNIKSVRINQRSPITEIPIPQLSSTCTVLVKTQGNIRTISVSWVIKNETCSVSTSCSCVKTIPQQLTHLFCTLESKSICQTYTINLACDMSVQNIIASNLDAIRTCSTPVTYNATWSFTVGSLTSTVEEGGCS